MGKRRGQGISSAWGIGGVAVVAAAVIALSGLALGQAEGASSANAGMVPSASRTTGTATAEPQEARLTAWDADEVRAAIAGTDDLVISVLGDSTGVGPDRWVNRYAQHLSSNATVTLHSWTEATQAYDPAQTIGDGPRHIEIWNGSYPGASYEYGLENLDDLQPVVPDLVIGNYGHNQGARPVDEGYTQLLSAMEAKSLAPIALVVTIQNPAQNERAAISDAAQNALAGWAGANDVPTVDVRNAFSGRLDLLRDNVHPNPQGSQVWLDAVVSTLG